MLRLDGRWLTPQIADGCLPGVYRGRLLEDGEVEEASVSLDDLHRAEEIAVTNALRGWRKAVLIE
jgi:branched-subunit amino acid aminotransferase/4-amino-4-deoxychorismate lyase